MQLVSTKPIYNLKVIVHETGLKPDTLRAWERRYGLPKPQRSPGGHRLYSQHDLEVLKWLLARQNDGMTISRAVALWEELSSTDKLPFQITEEHSGPTSQNIVACTNFDEQMADQVLTQGFSIFPIETICTEIMQPAMKAIGEGWYQGEITVAQEHFASSLVIRRLETMLSATPESTLPGRILVGCPAYEEHTIGPLILSLLLRRKGWDVLYLGANLPVVSFSRTVHRVKPNLVVLAAQQLHTAANLLDIASILQAERVSLTYGGMIFHQIPALQNRIPGHYLGHDFKIAVEFIQQYLTHNQVLNYPELSYQEQYTSAIHHFRERQAQIEATVWDKISHFDISQKNLLDTNINMGRDIVAALNLGDINHLALDLAWLEKFFACHYQIPIQVVRNYLQFYLEACQTHLEQPGDVITKWLTQLLNGK